MPVRRKRVPTDSTGWSDSIFRSDGICRLPEIDPCGVDQNVYVSERLLATLGNICNACNLTKIAVYRRCLAAGCLDRFNQRVQAILASRHQNDPSARLCEKPCIGMADSRTAPGDNRSAVVKVKQ